jgi:hypothetical protein
MNLYGHLSARISSAHRNDFSYDISLPLGSIRKLQYQADDAYLSVSVASFTDFGATLINLDSEVISALSSNPFTNPGQSVAIFSFAFTLLFVFVMGIVIFVRWDYFDYNRNLYVRGMNKERARLHVAEDLAKGLKIYF